MRAMIDALAGAAFKARGKLTPAETRAKRTLYTGLYLLGLAHWLFFFGLGRFSLNFHDWPKEAGYLAVLQQALRQGKLPLHIAPSLVTDRFLANPEVPLSPQILFLPYLDHGSFVLLNTLLMYSLGFLGLLLLGRRLRVSSLGFTLLFLLINFNGHITSHLAVGHSMWVGYFLLPYFMLLFLNPADTRSNIKWSIKLGLILFGVLLVGAFHFAIWIFIFLGALAVTQPQDRRSILTGMGLALGLGAVRLLPTALEFASTERVFVGGFQSTWDLFEGLVALKSPLLAVASRVGPPEWWEVDHYVGWVGLAFIASFGIAYMFKHSKEPGFAPVGALAPALILMAVLSLDPIFRALIKLPIPFIGAERVSSRIFILPLLFLVLFAVQGFEHWLRNAGMTIWAKRLSFTAVVILALDLWQHSRLWRIGVTIQALDPQPPGPLPIIQNQSDPEYTTALLVGAALTLVTLTYCLWRLARKPPNHSVPGSSTLNHSATEVATGHDSI